MLAVAAGCGSPAPSGCPLTVWYRPADADGAVGSAAPEVIGSWKGWARPGPGRFTTVSGDDGTEWRAATLHLPPGTYRYAIAWPGSDARVLDAVNPRTAFVADARTPF